MQSMKYENQFLIKYWGTTDRQQTMFRKITASQWTYFMVALAVSDIANILLAFRLAYSIRFDLSLSIFKLYVTPEISFYRSYRAAAS